MPVSAMYQFVFFFKEVSHFIWTRENFLGLQPVYHSLTIIVVVIAPLLPWDGGTAQMAIQVHVINLIEVRLGERCQPISNQS